MRKLTRELFGIAGPEKRSSRAADRLPTFHELRPLFEQELRRACRYERPLSVVVLGFARTLGRAQRAHRAAKLGGLLQEALRETDLVGYMAEKAELAALLPEADASTAARGRERIQQLWAAGDTGHLVSGAATYPADGLTLDDLVASARRSSLTVAVALNGQRTRIGSAADA
jgi:hypothetical protein